MCLRARIQIEKSIQKKCDKYKKSFVFSSILEKRQNENDNKNKGNGGNNQY